MLQRLGWATGLLAEYATDLAERQFCGAHFRRKRKSRGAPHRRFAAAQVLAGARRPTSTQFTRRLVGAGSTTAVAVVAYAPSAQLPVVGRSTRAGFGQVAFTAIALP